MLEVFRELSVRDISEADLCYVDGDPIYRETGWKGNSAG